MIVVVEYVHERPLVALSRPASADDEIQPQVRRNLHASNLPPWQQAIAEAGRPLGVRLGRPRRPRDHGGQPEPEIGSRAAILWRSSSRLGALAGGVATVARSRALRCALREVTVCLRSRAAEGGPATAASAAPHAADAASRLRSLPLADPVAVVGDLRCPPPRPATRVAPQ